MIKKASHNGETFYSISDIVSLPQSPMLRVAASNRHAASRPEIQTPIELGTYAANLSLAALPEIPPEEARRIQYAILAEQVLRPPGPKEVISQLVREYLGTTPLHLSHVKNTWGNILTPLLAVAMDRFLRDDSIQVDESFVTKHEYGNVIAPMVNGSLRPIEVGLNRVENLHTSGVRFLTWEGTKLAVSFDFASWENALSVFATREKEDHAAVFMRLFAAACEEHNIYRHQNLKFSNGSLTFAEMDKVGLDNVFVPEELKAELVANVLGSLREREALSERPGGLHQAFLLEGKPGVGKTLLFKALASSAEACTTIWASGQSFSCSEDVQGLFAAAQDLGPTLLVFEDIDLLGTRNRGSGNPILGEVLTQMSGPKALSNVIVLGSTNSLVNIDEALNNRPGRFLIRNLPDPGPELRAAMVKSFVRLQGAKLSVSKTSFNKLVKESAGFTGDYLSKVINQAVTAAVVGGVRRKKSGRPDITEEILGTAFSAVRLSYDLSNTARRLAKKRGSYEDLSLTELDPEAKG